MLDFDFSCISHALMAASQAEIQAKQSACGPGAATQNLQLCQVLDRLFDLRAALIVGSEAQELLVIADGDLL